MAGLEITLLNAFNINLDGMPVTNFRSDKVKALLIYLVLESDRAHDRSALATLLWPEASKTAASNNFRQSLYRLRRVLGDTQSEEKPFLIVDRSSVSFNRSSAYHSDVDHFSVALAGGDLDSAVAIYQGDLLPGFTCDSPDFEDWLRQKRQQFHHQALQALYDLTEQQLTLGGQAYLEAQATARRQLTLEPWREEAHRQLMRALYLGGDRSAALAQYAACSDILAEELGVPPAPETTNLYEGIRDGRLPTEEHMPSPEPISTFALPRPTTPIIGRETELKSLLHALLDPWMPLVTIVGAGGIGKTRLAIEAGHRLVNIQDPIAHPFQDGVVFVSLAGLSDPDDLPEAIASALGLKLIDRSTPTAQLTELLKSKALLLILDNFEHLDSAAPLVSALLQSAQRVQVCITSRQRLNIDGETVLSLSGLETPSDPLLVEEASASRLFIQSAARASLDFSVRPPDLPHISRICNRVEGMPLAIVLASGWVDTLSVEEIADEIQQDFDFLTTEKEETPERLRSMRAAFDYSWKLLDEKERDIFMSISVFRGSFTRQAAQAVSGTPLRLLARLVSKSLLQYDPDKKRYHVHELLRQFSAEKLEQKGNLDSICTLHSNFYLDEVTIMEAGVRGGQDKKALPIIAADYENIRAAWRWAVSQNHFEKLNPALESLLDYFDLSGRQYEGIALFKHSLDVLAAAKKEPHVPLDELEYLEARIAIRRFALLVDFPHFKDVQVEEYLEIFQARGDELESALTLAILARMAFERSDYQKAVEFQSLRLESYRRLKDRYRYGRTFGNLAFAQYQAGQPEEARKSALRCLEIMRELGNRRVAANALNLIAWYDLFVVGDYEAASARYHEAAELEQELDQKGYSSFIHARRTLVALLLGQFELARQIGSQARESLPDGEIESPGVQLPYVKSHFGLLQVVDGHFQTGQELLSDVETNTIWSRSGPARLGMAIIDWSKRDPESARNRLLRDWPYLLRVSWFAFLVWTLPVAAFVLAENGRPDRAVEILALGRNHPACPHGWWDGWKLLQELEVRLRAELTAEELEAAQANGKQLELTKLIALLLDEALERK